MASKELAHIWGRARKIDPTLRVFRGHWSALLRRRLKADCFSRDLLFRRMAAGQPLLATGVRVPVRGEERLGKKAAVVRALIDGLPHTERVRVRCGYLERARMLKIHELVRRWSGGRAKVTVTDLHIRATNVLRYINCSSLSRFNLLTGGSEEISTEEMLTVVVSSAGTLTDSHSDDPDGSNHCFVGRKLWLVWDTFLGIKHGLQDFERCKISGPRAPFTIERFLSIPGSRWFVVEPGYTLFLPGNLTHKVITLEDYLGVGSFYVILPSYMRAVERWTLHTALWALSLPKVQQMDKVNLITRRVLHKVKFLLQAGSQEQEYWGLGYLQKSTRAWCSKASKSAREAMVAHRPSRDLLQTCNGSLS